MDTKTVAYPVEMLDTIKAEYAERREAGEANATILADLSAKFDRSVPSIRTKLMVEKVYVKDTEGEKEEKASAKIPKADKAPKVTKLDRAKAFLAKLEVADPTGELAKDLSKVKAATLDALKA